MTEKLKNLVRPRTLEFILADLKGKKTFMKKIERENTKIESFYSGISLIEFEDLDKRAKQVMIAMKDFVMYNELMYALQGRNHRYYNQLKRNIKENKGEAEINIKYLEKLFPNMSGLNSIFRIYGEEITA